MKRSHVTRKSSPRDRESGQAMVEFALILFPLLLLVSGIIQFGIGLNFWLDMNRLANQGARFAAVNCGTQATPPQCTPSLQQWLESQAISRGNNPTVAICYESITGNFGGAPSPTVGDPVTVRLSQPFEVVPFIDIWVDLKASATMRLEQRPSKGGLDDPALGLCPATW